MSKTEEQNQNNDAKSKDDHTQYLRFAAMIATSMVLMFIVMYLHTYQLSHVEWSETRIYMTLLMGSTMSIVMLAFMLGMYKNPKINLGIFVGSIAIFIAALALVRTQNTVDDQSYMSAMIPHHSIAILTSENSNITDYRVCELAVKIIKAQQREIDEMQWLIKDIEKNGHATTKQAADMRKIPKFTGESIRSC